MSIMSAIIPPVNKDLLLSELTKDKMLRKSNYGNTEIYVFSCNDSPNLALELGRLREITFRMAGGGTGKEIDIDRYDTGEDPYLQLIVWDPDEKEIIGGYRYILGESVVDNPNLKLATTHLFDFSDTFTTDYLPYTIELGRSFVQPKYQYTIEGTRKGMYALDNLWDGLGALIVEYPEMKYFFGKITMYKHFDLQARNLILTFINHYFQNKNNLVIPKKPLDFNFEETIKNFKLNDYKEDYRILKNLVKNNNEKIPPLINAYMNLSPSMISFGTVENDVFGGVEETGILIKIEDIYNTKKDRHVKTYNQGQKKEGFLQRNRKLFKRKWSLKMNLKSNTNN